MGVSFLELEHNQYRRKPANYGVVQILYSMKGDQQNDETTLFIRGGGCLRQPCAVCTGAAHECSTEPAEHLPILGRRYSYNDEQNPTGTALAWDDMGANHRLYAESSRQHTPRGQYRRRVGSCADGGSDAGTHPPTSATGRQWRNWRMCNRPGCYTRSKRRFAVPHNSVEQRKFRGDTNISNWRQQAYAHRQQVHGLLYVAAHRLTPKGVAV